MARKLRDYIYAAGGRRETGHLTVRTIVLENLTRRKQRLYIHSYGKGQYFDLVKSQLVEPTGGDVIEAVFE